MKKLTDEQKDGIWDSLPDIKIHNEASSLGIRTEVLLRRRFADAIIAANWALNADDRDVMPLMDLTRRHGATHTNQEILTMLAAPTPPAEQQAGKSELNPPLPKDLLYTDSKRAEASGAKLRCRKCGDSYEITFNHAVSQSEGVGQQGELEHSPIVYKRSEFTKNWTTFNVRREHADMAEARLKGPDVLAELRWMVESLSGQGDDKVVLRTDVLREIDKLGGKV